MCYGKQGLLELGSGASSIGSMIRLSVIRMEQRCVLAIKMSLSLLFGIALLLWGAGAARGQNDDPEKKAISLFEQAQNAHEKEDLDQAIGLYSKAIELMPEFPEAELQRGNAYLSQKKLTDAERSFRKALELRQNWSLAKTSLGSLLVTLRKFEEAEVLLNGALEDDEANPLALSALAELKLALNVSEASLRDLLSRISDLTAKMRPTAGLLSSKAALEQRLGDVPGAKESVARALQIDPQLTSALVIAADIALIEKDIEKADTYVRRIEALSPKSPEVLTLRSRVLYSQGKRAEALALLESIPNPSESVRELIAMAKDGDVADLQGLEAKIRRTPDDVNALSKLCVGFRVSDPARALEYCRRASILEPKEISHAVAFGAALVQAKQYVEAIGLFRKLLTLAPEHVTIHTNLATALFQLKRYDEAKNEFRWLTEHQPASAAAFYFLAITHDHLGEYLDAMATYQKFLRIADPNASKLEIEKVNLRLPALQKLIKDGKGKKAGK